MTTVDQPAKARSNKARNILLLAVALLVIAGGSIAAVLATRSDEAPPKLTPDYAAVTRDLVSIMFPGSVASSEQVQEMLPAAKRSADTACDNLAHMTRQEVVDYTRLTVGDSEKADAFVASMERNVCSRK